MSKQGRVLIVDDKEKWREELVETLQRGDYYVDSVSTTAQALERLDETQYHLVVLDIRMDDSDKHNEDGMKLLHELIRRDLSEVIKVIMLSAYGTKEQMRIAFREYQVVDFLSKDEFDNLAFLENVQRVFSKEMNINLALEIQWQQVSGPEQVVINLVVDGVRVKQGTPFQDRIANELENLLCCLFYQAESIMVQPLTPSQNSMGGLLVQPSYTTGGGSAVVVRFGNILKIEEEYHNFKEYVQPFVGGGRNTTILDVRRTSHLGGIIYSLLSGANDHWEDFENFYHHADLFKIREALNRLFLDTCGAWYANPGLLHSRDLTADYQQLFDLTAASLEQALYEELKSVQGKKRLYFRSLGNERAFTNPLLVMAGQPFVHSTYLCTTHGNFNQHNILVDSTGQVWLINFQGTGQSHILRDVAMLDSVVRFQLLTAEEATLEERLEMEEALCSIEYFSQLEQLATNHLTENRALAKAYAAVVHLRNLARKLVAQNPSDAMSEYYIALLYNALNFLRFSSLPATQREHALLCASLLADRLGFGGQDEILWDRDTSEILSAISDRSFHNYQQLAETIIRRMDATNPILIKSPYFEHGTVWQVSLPVIGLRLRTQKAILLLRQAEHGYTSYEHLYKHLTNILGKEEHDFIIVIDIIDIHSIPLHPAYRVVWFQPESLIEMATLLKEELLGWLGRFITTRVDVRPLLPYQTTGATELFFGRDYELMRLISGNLCRGIIIGAHRSGKTSLLYQIRERLKQRDLEVVGPITFPKVKGPQYFFERTLDPLKIDCPTGMTPESWSSALRTYSKEKNRNPVFLLDEVDNLLAVDIKTEWMLGRHMRSLQSDGYCEFYLAGHARLREVIALEESPFRNFAEEIVLTGLIEAASMSLIQDPMKLIGFYISDAQSHRIFKGTAGVPVLIQEFCIRLLCGRLHLDGKPKIEDAEIKAVEQSPDYLNVVFEHYKYGQGWISTSVMLISAIYEEVSRHDVITEFSKFGIKLGRDQLDMTLGFLVKFGVLEEFKIGHYRVKSRYLREAIMNSEPSSLLDENIKDRRKKKGR